MSLRRALFFLFILAAIAALGYLALFRVPAYVASQKTTAAFSGLASPPSGGDFVLHGADGPVALKDYRGKVVLLYFGYAYCPDICPTSLAVLVQVFNELPPQARDKVRGIFISVDPARDTPAYLKEYTAFFHPFLTGATGNAEEIAEAARRYGVIYRVQPPDAEGRYTVDHSSLIYVIDPDGRLAAILPHGVTAAEVGAALRPWLENADGNQNKS